MRWLVLALCAHGALAFGAGEPPVFATVDAVGPTRLVLRGHLTRARAAAVEARARLVVADVARRFPPARSEPKAEVAVYVFEKRADYQRFADTVAGTRPSELGFYLPGRRIVVVNLAYGLKNLSHELVHPLVGDDFPQLPSWLNEGLGSLYGGSEVAARGLRFSVNYRMRDVHAALREGALPTLAELARADSAEVYGERVMVWYGLARAALLYLASRGELSSFYLAVRSGTPLEVALAARADEAGFRAFAQSARVGAPVAEPR